MPSGHFPRRLDRKPRTKSGYKGVIYQRCDPPLKKPWRVYVRRPGRTETIGYYATKEEAAAAYNKEMLRMYGPKKVYLNPLRSSRSPS